MAVAVKDTSQAASSHVNRLAVGSLLGTVYVLASIVTAFYLLPQAWSMTVSQWIAGGGESVVDKSLLILIVFAAVVGLVVLGQKLVGANPPPGLRAGVFVGVVGV